MLDNNSSSASPKPLFDMTSSEGVNDSERILTKLCQRSFLRLWSQTNVFTDEGFKEGKGRTKELCDALVIFGDDVIIFSDKHVKYQADRELHVAWPRWYRRTVLDSFKQLYGAKSWLMRFPERAFLDAKCSRKLPIAVPSGPNVRFHLVAVTRGSRDAVLAHNGGDGLGSIALNSALEGDAHFTAPFMLGRPVPERAFVHVFDEVSVELVMKELDTAVDFLDYLRARDELLGRSGCQVIAPGEEELLAAYLRTMDRTGARHVFIDVGPEDGLPDLAMFDGSQYEGLYQDPGYLRKKEADRISYEWDALIDRFLTYGDPNIHARALDQTSAETEQGLRLLAAESRFQRRQLAESFIGALERVEPGMRLGRVVNRQAPGETVFVFLVMPMRDERDYADYREHRMAVLHAYVRTARLKAAGGTTFVGIAFDNPHKSYRGGSEDLFVFSQDTWTKDELTELETMQRDLGLWRENTVEWRCRQDEYPQASQANPQQLLKTDDLKSSQVRVNNARKVEKRRQKMQQLSRRRNRGRK